MIPLKDHLPTARVPSMTILLILVNVLVYALGFAQAPTNAPGQVQVSRHDVWVYEYGLIPCELFGRCENQAGRALVNPTFMDATPRTVPIQVPDANPWLTILTSAFLHGSLMHLAFNMLFFWVFGNNLEDSMGRWTFLGFYLSGGVLAALLQSIAAPGSHVPLIGASGAIAATIGGYLRLYPRSQMTALVMIVPMRLPAWIVAGFWGVTQIYAGWQSLVVPGAGQEGGVAYLAHVGGFVFGLLVAVHLAELNPIYERLYGRHPVPDPP